MKDLKQRIGAMTQTIDSEVAARNWDIKRVKKALEVELNTIRETVVLGGD